MKNRNRPLGLIAIAAVIGLFFTACDGGSIPTPTVTGVTVSPYVASVERGQTRQFSAIVIGTNSPDQTVIWAVEGGGAGTSISQSGLLTVGVEETPTSLTVRATSAFNTTISGTATVNVAATPITSVAITGITAPVTGAVPVTTASGVGNFTIGSVSWNPNNNPFTAGTVYTASVTLTANSGFTFTGLATATIDAQTATVANNTGTAVTLSRTFPVTSLLDMVRIPAGTFTMGSPENQPGRWHPDIGWGTPEFAETQRQVTLTQGFYMGSFQVTRAQWHSVMGTSPWGAGAADNTALTHVSWYDAILFANRLSIQSGLTAAYYVSGVTNWLTVTAPTSNNLAWNAATVVAGSTGYRLPTEAQWEYAARAGTATAFNDGVTNDWNETAAVRLLGWFWGAPGGNQVRAVGQLRPNAWGLYDMHGNVWEWVWDRWGTYPAGPCTDPTGPTSGTVRVIRGGSWVNFASFLRSAQRSFYDPASRWNLFGFRLVRP